MHGTIVLKAAIAVSAVLALAIGAIVPATAATPHLAVARTVSTISPQHVMVRSGTVPTQSLDGDICSFTQPTSFGAAPIAGSIVGSTQDACFTFTDPAPNDTVLVNVDSTSGGSTPTTHVANGTSSFQCGFMLNTTGANCLLNASGDWTIEESDPSPGSFVITIQSLANPVGCQTVDYGPNLITSAVSQAAAADCYVLTTPLDFAAITFSYTSANFDPAFLFYGPNGDRAGACNPAYGTGADIATPGTWLIMVQSCSGTATGTVDLRLQDLGLYTVGNFSLAQALPHQRIQMWAEGFEPNERVTFTYGTGLSGEGNIKLCSATAQGEFNRAVCSAALPKEPTAGLAGERTVTGIGKNSGHSVSAVFDLTVPPTSCARATGSTNGSVTLLRCTPASSTDTTSAIVFGGLLSGGTLTWSPSGETTEISVSSSSPGRGDCPKGGTEEDVSGSVTGGTASSTQIGDPVSMRLCEKVGGLIGLVKGTTVSL